MRVTIIGAGPAGLAAAHAAIGLGVSVVVRAPAVKTPQRGPILLLRPIPGINTEQPEGYIRQLVVGGSILDYRIKLYGDQPLDLKTSQPEPGYHTWRVTKAYDRLWELYSKLIQPGILYPGDIETICDSNDLVINAASAKNLCMVPKRHVFQSVAVALKVKSTYPSQPPNTVIYNGDPATPWVRSSRIFEHESTEYAPGTIDDPDIVIWKPISNTCTCHPRVLRVGRSGTHKNLAWIDSAFYDSRTVIYNILHRHEWEGIV